MNVKLFSILADFRLMGMSFYAVVVFGQGKDILFKTPGHLEFTNFIYGICDCSYYVWYPQIK